MPSGNRPAQARPALGTHLSISKGFARAGADAVAIGAATMQFFLRNPRGAGVKALDAAGAADLEALAALLRENAFAPVVAHAPYTLNPCSPGERVREQAVSMLADDLARMEYLPGNLYCLHPGSHVGQGPEAAAKLTATALNAVLRPRQATTVLLEGMSGKGSELGWSFDELRNVLEQVELPEKTGVCFDACHLYAAGYDIVNDLDGVLTAFDKTVGLQKLRAFHLNDSLHPLGSRKDRHAAIGEGHISLAAIARIISHPALRHLPFITETPLDLHGHAEELALLRETAARLSGNSAPYPL